MSFIAYQIKKVSGAKDHGKNDINVRPPPVRHLLHDHLFCHCVKNVIKFLTFMHWKSNQFYAHLIYKKDRKTITRTHQTNLDDNSLNSSSQIHFWFGRFKRFWNQLIQVIPRNDQNTSPTNQKTARSKLERTS